MGHYHPGHPGRQRRFSRDELEELLAGELPGDDDPGRPIRGRLERRLDQFNELEAAAAQRDEGTDDLGPRELADLVSRSRSTGQPTDSAGTEGDDDPRSLADRVPRR